jgi:hypothetical protein
MATDVKNLVTLNATASEADDVPSFQSPEYQAQLSGWSLNRDAMRGPDALRASPSTYLPKAPAETQDEYNDRTKYADAPSFFNTAVEGMTGMVFAADPVLGDDVPPEIRDHWENIDGEGTSGPVFLKNFFRDILQTGHAGILVDYPNTGTLPPPANRKVYSIAEEKSLKLRPYWCHIRAEQMINWRTVTLGAETVLEQVTVCTTRTTRSGRFGSKRLLQYRTYTLNIGPSIPEPSVTWEIWEIEEEKRNSTDLRDYVITTGTMLNQVRIPMCIAYAGEKIGTLQSCPPLNNLAHLSFSYARILSDHRRSLHLAGNPILVFVGRARTASKSKVRKEVIGPNSGLDLPQGGDAKYVEHSGSALGQSRQELLDMKSEAAEMSLAMLQRETRAAETAEAKRIDKAQSDSRLATAARAAQDCGESALGYHASFMGKTIKPKKPAKGQWKGDVKGSLTIRKDFDELTLDETVARFYFDMVVAGKLTLRTMWKLLQRGNMLPEDFVPEDEESDLAMQGAFDDDGDEDADGEEDPIDGDKGTEEKPVVKAEDEQ